MKSFDDLFNEFFNRKRGVNPLHEELKKIIESLTNFKSPSMDAEDLVAQQLGLDPDKPTSKEEIIEDGMRFTKLTWDTPKGKFVKIFVTDVVNGEIPTKEFSNEEKSLEEQLQDAVDNEDYELAIKLRDEIKAKTTPTEKPKRKTKKSS